MKPSKDLADTEISMVHDKKIIAACGETELANPKKTIITMMQVSQGVALTDPG